MDGVQIAMAVITVLIGIIEALIGFIIYNMKMDIKDLQKEVKEVRTNYLSRFEDVKEHATQNKEELKDELHKLELTIVDLLPKKRTVKK